MTLQSTPPLADPLTGRIPSYTQTLQQDPVTGVWTIMYDVSNVPTQSTTGAISSMQSVQQQTQQAAQDSIEQGLTTPVETFPDYGEQTGSTPFDTTPVDPQDPIFLQGGPGGGEGQGRGDAGTTGPGIARSPFTGDFYSEDGTRLPDLAQQALSAFMSYTTIGNLANLNTTHDFVTRDLSVQQSIMDQERDAIMGMDVQDRANTYGRMNRAAQRMGTTAATALGSHSGVGLQGFGNINPGVADAIGTGQEEGRSTDGPRGGAGPYSEQNRRATEAATQPTAREAARAGQYGSDSNFGGFSEDARGPGTDASTMGGTGGRRGGAGTAGTGPTGPGGQSPGPQGQRGGSPSGSASSGVGGQSPGPGGQRGGRGGGGGGSGGSGGAGGGGPAGCFVKGTMVQMANGTEKEITTIDIGDKIRGGIVQAKMEFMPQNIYNYKGVLVSGSHWVVENNQFIEVEDSKHGILTDKVEPVYTFKTSDNRIWINNIEFGDFETGSDEDWAPYFEKVKQDLNKKLRGEA
jgi:hypothetical protein